MASSVRPSSVYPPRCRHQGTPAVKISCLNRACERGAGRYSYFCQRGVYIRILYCAFVCIYTRCLHARLYAYGCMRLYTYIALELAFTYGKMFQLAWAPCQMHFWGLLQHESLGLVLEEVRKCTSKHARWPGPCRKSAEALRMSRMPCSHFF